MTVIASTSGASPSARLEIGGGVRARRRADVAALDVADHEQPGRPRVLADVLERPHAVGAERLEERALRLDGDGVRADRVDQAAAEARVRGRRRLTAGVRVAAELRAAAGRAAGSRPTTSWLRRSTTAAASLSANARVATAAWASIGAQASEGGRYPVRKRNAMRFQRSVWHESVFRKRAQIRRPP